MPYIKQNLRDKIMIGNDEIDINVATINEGNLNYTITKLCHAYVRKHGLNYSVLNTVIGVLAASSMEFYRKIVAPYEDKKIQENGDVSVDFG